MSNKKYYSLSEFYELINELKYLFDIYNGECKNFPQSFYEYLEEDGEILLIKDLIDYSDGNVSKNNVYSDRDFLINIIDEEYEKPFHMITYLSEKIIKEIAYLRDTINLCKKANKSVGKIQQKFKEKYYSPGEGLGYKNLKQRNIGFYKN